MMLVVSPIYLALATLMLLVLSIRIILLRVKYKAKFGDKNEPLLQKAIRAHGNFTEYVPLALLMLVVLDWFGTTAWILHWLGGSLLLGRLLHAWGVSQLHEVLLWRLSGMVLTFLSLLISAIMLLVRLSGF